MDKDRLIKLIETPEMASLEDFEAILERINQFPYCQNYRILAAKIAYDNSFKDKDNLLKQAAIYVNDRLKLKEIILKPYTELAEEEVLDIPKSVDKETVNEELAIEYKEEDIALHEFKAGEVDESLNLKPIRFEELEVPELATPDSFAVFSKNQDQYNEEKIDIVKETEELEKFKEESNEGTKQDLNDLVDIFLQNEPRISKLSLNDKVEEAPKDLTANLSTEHECFTSETLAKIYKNQGRNSEAIDIYERLILKYPEKKAYFVNQINIIQ